MFSRNLVIFFFFSSLLLSLVPGFHGRHAWSEELSDKNIRTSLKLDFGNASMENQRVAPRVQLYIEDEQVTVDNGILKLKISKTGGRVISLEYNGIENLLEFIKGSANTGGYWDVNWDTLGSNKDLPIDRIDGKEFAVIINNVNQVELSFKTTWNPSLTAKVPLNIDKRFIVLRGSSGFYCYAIFEHKQDWPGFELQETRMAFKLNKDMFRYMAISDYRQREMPLPEDRDRDRSIVLA